jgi:hypothetical protein
LPMFGRKKNAISGRFFLSAYVVFAARSRHCCPDPEILPFMKSQS